MSDNNKHLDESLDSKLLLDDSKFDSRPPSPKSQDPKNPREFPPVPMILRFPRGPRKNTRTKNLHTFVKRLLIYDTIVVLCGMLTFLDCFMLNTDFKNSYILVGNALNTMIMLFPMMLALPLLFAQYPMARALSARVARRPRDPRQEPAARPWHTPGNSGRGRG